MTNLTDAQRELLARGAAEPDGVIDAPADAKAARTLIKQGLAISLPVAGGASRLLITDAGRAALAVPAGGEATAARDAADVLGQEPGEPADAAAADRPAPKEPGGKLGKLVELLKRPQGVTLEEMVAETGWQAHSVRGAMSGSLKKKQGLAITSAKTDGARVYKIAEAA